MRPSDDIFPKIYYNIRYKIHVKLFYTKFLATLLKYYVLYKKILHRKLINLEYVSYIYFLNTLL